MPASLTKIVAGFIAGFLAVLIFHQAMYLFIQSMGWPLRGAPWSMAADPAAFNMPRVLNQAFWGGLWGILFALMLDVLPGGMSWLKGIVFGLVFPMLIGSWLAVALIKGQPVFSGAFAKGFDILALRNGFLLNGIAFGLGLGLIYPVLAGMMSRRGD